MEQNFDVYPDEFNVLHETTFPSNMKKFAVHLEHLQQDLVANSKRSFE